MTIAEKTMLIVISIILLLFFLFQIKFNTEIEASISDLRNTVDTLYKTSVENEEDKCEIYKRLADLEEGESDR